MFVRLAKSPKITTHQTRYPVVEKSNCVKFKDKKMAKKLNNTRTVTVSDTVTVSVCSVVLDQRSPHYRSKHRLSNIYYMAVKLPELP